MALTKTLSGALRHADAPDLAAELAAILAEDDLTIETADLTQVSCGIVQVIAAAQVTARVLDRNLQVQVAADTPFATALDRLGLQL
jgi:anti-anti-sigma regulatory factor